MKEPLGKAARGQRSPTLRQAVSKPFHGVMFSVASDERVTSRAEIAAFQIVTPLDAALLYARNGWHIFPVFEIVKGRCACANPDCKKPGKHPRIKEWESFASCDESQIRKWWMRWPNANIAWALGRDGRAGIDVDPRHDGDESFSRLEAKLGCIDTARQGTGGGGEHHVVCVPPGVALQSRTEAFGGDYPGVDFKTTGGYILIPPSRHFSGGTYTWDLGSPGAIALPQSWIDVLLAQQNGNGGRKHVPGVDDGERIALGRRRDVLKSLAGRLRHNGMNAASIYDALVAVAARQCDPPYTTLNELKDLQRMADDFARYEPGRAMGTNRGDRDAQAEPEWAKPTPLSKLLPSVQSLPLEMIPLPFRAAIADVADRMNVPLEMVAVPQIIAAGSLIGRTLGMRPRQYDDWTEYANLWGVVIGRPALKKSPALRYGLKPFRCVERQLHEAFVEAEADRAPKRHVIELDIARIERLIKTAKTITSKGDLPPDDLVERLRAQEANRSKLIAPEPRRSATDVTPEKLADLHADNPRGMLLINDELVAMLREFDKVGRENSRAFCLAAWAGNVAHPIDRIGRGSTFVPGLCLAIIGTATPGAMRVYIREAQGTAAGADGLLQRFQLMIWVDELLPFRHVDRAPDADASKRVRDIFLQIERLDPPSFGAWSDGDDDPPFVRFDAAGQRLFDQWYERQDGIVRACADMPALESHLAKYPKLFAALALIFHVTSGLAIGVLTNRVGAEAAALAANWCDFLEQHARRVYAEGGTTPVESFADHLLRGTVPDGMSLRDVCQRRWSGLTSTKAVRDAANTLVEAGWIRLHQVPAGASGGCPPSPQIFVNPEIREGVIPK